MTATNEELARAWDEGRESLAADFLNPVRTDGTRQPTTNPYRVNDQERGTA